MPKIIGLSGFAKSGKTTAMSFLREMGGKEVAFAEHLKDVCSVVLGIERVHFDDQNFKEKPFKSTIILTHYHIEQILKYFEVPQCRIPKSILEHQYVRLVSPRHVAQYVGTDILRSIDPDIHIKMAFKLNEKTDADFLICSDVRFENEYDSVINSGGIIIGIERESITPPQSVALHASEKEIPILLRKPQTNLIKNNSTIEYLRRELELSVNFYLNKKYS